MRRGTALATALCALSALLAFVASPVHAAATPTVGVGDGGIVEGNSGVRNASIPVTLSDPVGSAVTVMYDVTAGSATAGTDFTRVVNKHVTIKAGQTKAAISVKVLQDTAAESDETVDVTLHDPAGAVLGRTSGVVTIFDDDDGSSSGPQLSVGDVGVVEGDSGGGASGTIAKFPVMLDAPNPSATPVTVKWSTFAVTASTGSDFTPVTNKLLTFKTGVYKKYVSVKIVRDTSAEGDQLFVVGLSDASGASLYRNAGSGTIINDDGISTTTSLQATPNPSSTGQQVTLTATVTPATGGPPTGSVTFSDGTTVLGTTGLVAGVAQLTTSSLTAGTHLLGASYGGSAQHRASDAPPVAQVVMAIGHRWAFGDNHFGQGQLGDGTIDPEVTPEQVGTEQWRMVESSSISGYGIRDDGTLWSWGDNSHGELGDGTRTDRLSPVQVGTASDWVTVAAGGIYDGSMHALGIRSDGTLWAWGANESGELGDGTTTERLSPVPVGTDTDWVAISAGGQHSLALKRNGTLWAWGNDGTGQLGDNGSTNQLAPEQIGTDTHWSAIAAGWSAAGVVDHSFSLGVKSDGTLWAWGYNGYGQLGQNDNTDRSVPTQIGSATNWKSVTAGDETSHALKTDGTLWGWGRNTGGEIGYGSPGDQKVPVQVGTDTDWAVVDGGGIHTLALKQDGTLWAWGSGSWGQLGNNNPADQYAPIEVSAATGWISIAAGSVHSLAVGP
jgi:alpha-tubulin suppressor-like RCC1 family protein